MYRGEIPFFLYFYYNMDCFNNCCENDKAEYEIVYNYPPNVSNKKKRLLRKRQKQLYRRRVKMYLDTIVEERNENNTINDFNNEDIPEWIII